MRNFYALFFLMIFYTASGQNQPEIVPLENNPVLQKLQSDYLTQRAEAATALLSQSQSRNLGDPCVDFFNVENRYEDGTALYAQSGTDLRICVPLSSVDSFSCANCEDLSLGSAFISPNESCIIFTAADVTQLENEPLVLVACDTADNECQTFNYDLNVYRANKTIVEDLTFINAKDQTDLCLNTISLPGSSRRYSYGNHELRLAFLSYQPDSCISYTARRFAEIDTVNIFVSDENCITDLHKLPVKIIGDTLSIDDGFMDDFSSQGPYPVEDRWLDDDVYINDHFTHDPLSRGVATFDGLDFTGSPKGGGYGRSDFLTSNYLDLSGLFPADDVYLSFYVQPKGVGFTPEMEDSLVLEFKDVTGRWNKMAEFVNDSVGSIFDTIPFQGMQSIHIDDTDYLYDGFQFRFVNYDNRRGIVDIWNLDYVVLDKGVVPNGEYLDMAFTRPLPKILKNYRAMPWNHFEGFEDQELFEELNFGVINHFGVDVALNNSSVTLEELKTGTNLSLSGFSIISAQAFEPGELRNTSLSTAPVISSLINQMQSSFAGESDLTFRLSATLNVSSAQESKFSDVLQNDNASSLTCFKDYFAHDDGTAEFGIKTTATGTQIAVAFDANVADSIRAIQMHFPHITPVPNVEFQLKIWENDLEGEPIYVSPVFEPFYADTALDTFQAFTTYRLLDENGNFSPVGIGAGTFYIGWEQVSSINHQVYTGFDRQNIEAGVNNFFFNGNNWVPIDDDGAIMIRPVLGMGIPNSTSNKDLESFKISIFPNPANNILNIDLDTENGEN